ncbi:MAG TPA: pantetheine-phosphate adenylyltransferase [Sphingobacteriaceae bacterium]|nr:pantetheine-phosphate adenylyltransferase [Sphingobacteriaceae bacterium]
MTNDLKIAVFPGSFDPFTQAHFDLVQRGLNLFDQVIVAIGVNSSKKNMFSLEQRLEMISKTFQDETRVKTVFYRGLTIDFCRDQGAQFILRGIRNLQDYESERAIAQHNKALNPALETVFLLSPGHLSHISSTIVREILINKGNASPFLPSTIWEAVKP